MPFVTQYRPSVANIKQALMKKWYITQNQPREIFKEPPTVSFKKGKSLKDILVRAKINKRLSRFTMEEIVQPVNPCYLLLLTPSKGR